MNYTKEKLGSIYFDLAIGEDDIRSRLANCENNLLIIKTQDFPLELQSEWTEIISLLTKKGPQKNINGVIELGSVKNTVLKMRKKNVSELAKRIVNLYYRI